MRLHTGVSNATDTFNGDAKHAVKDLHFAVEATQEMVGNPTGEHA
jgi:hypothetical protein